ncbi:MAG: hypothetical protein HY366_01245, partial [Candidatus Aenigmarchaeota archaeon]|nr:hypothetical protein [Candidatus Aenigmarchaeota archaeon]
MGIFGPSKTEVDQMVREASKAAATRARLDVYESILGVEFNDDQLPQAEAAMQAYRATNQARVNEHQAELNVGHA